MDIFRESGALLEGHFLLTSGYHGTSYMEKFQVLQYPRHVERLCESIAEPFTGKGIDVVLGPTTGGVLLAYEVAKQLGVRSLYAERGDDGKSRALRRGFRVDPSERVLVVDDIMTTGGSIFETIQIVKDAGAILAGVGVIADRSDGNIDFGVPFIALTRLIVEKYPPDAIPNWLAAIPLTERGSAHNLKKV